VSDRRVAAYRPEDDAAEDGGDGPGQRECGDRAHAAYAREM